MMAASVSADVPNWFLSLTFAPALISARTSSRSSFDAAHMIAVVPSGPGAFGFGAFRQQRNAAARSPCSAASSKLRQGYVRQAPSRRLSRSRSLRPRPPRPRPATGSGRALATDCGNHRGHRAPRIPVLLVSSVLA